MYIFLRHTFLLTLLFPNAIIIGLDGHTSFSEKNRQRRRRLFGTQLLVSCLPRSSFSQGRTALTRFGSFRLRLPDEKEGKRAFAQVRGDDLRLLHERRGNAPLPPGIRTRLLQFAKIK